jgi:hypothetical protein
MGTNMTANTGVRSISSEWMNENEWKWMDEWGGLSKWVFWPGMIDCTEKDYEIFNTYSIINY